MSKSIYFITSNPSKAKYLSEYFEIPVKHRFVHLDEIQSLDLIEVVKHKAIAAYKEIKAPVLVDDVSLVFNSLGKLPGPLIRWFLDSMGNEGLCKILNQYEDRSASATVAFCLYDGKEAKVFTSTAKGSISKSPRGDNGFGWDPIFVPSKNNKTWAEMTEAERQKTFARRIALDKLKKYILTDLIKKAF